MLDKFGVTKCTPNHPIPDLEFRSDQASEPKQHPPHQHSKLAKYHHKGKLINRQILSPHNGKLSQTQCGPSSPATENTDKTP
jgi:hypothetical protein